MLERRKASKTGPLGAPVRVPSGESCRSPVFEGDAFGRGADGAHQEGVEASHQRRLRSAPPKMLDFQQSSLRPLHRSRAGRPSCLSTHRRPWRKRLRRPRSLGGTPTDYTEGQWTLCVKQQRQRYLKFTCDEGDL